MLRFTNANESSTAGRFNYAPFGSLTETPPLGQMDEHHFLKLFAEAKDVLSGAWLRGARAIDPVFEPLRVRQVGWTGGIYTHAVGQIIRRRTGPLLTDCTYWQCIKNTNEVVTLADGTRIVGDGGEDPSALPDYWVTSAGPDSSAVNSYIVSRFIDDPRNIIIGDCVTEGTPLTIYKARKDVMLMSDATPPTANAVPAPGDRFAFFTSPTSEALSTWLQPLHCATWTQATNTWSLGNRFGYMRTPPITSTLPRGSIVERILSPSGARDHYRLRADVNFPPAGNPANDAVRFHHLVGRTTYSDPNFPTPYCNVAVVNQTGTPTVTRRFLHSYRYRRLDIESRIVSVFDYERGGSSAAGNTTFTETIEILPSGKVRHTPYTPPSTMAEHPLADPLTVIPGGITTEVARCKIYDADGSIEWIGGRPKFIKPGEYIHVTNIPTSGPIRFVRRFHYVFPVFYPNPAGNFTGVTAGNFNRAVISFELQNGISVTPRPLRAITNDWRTLTDIDRLFYPGQRSRLYFKSNETEQEEWYIPAEGENTADVLPTVRWAFVQWRWADNNTTATGNSQIDPMIFVRQKLALTVPNKCSNEAATDGG
jgi:hypothetical protein